MKNIISETLLASADLKTQIAHDAELVSALQNCAQLLIKTIKQGGEIFVCGNGGSACDAMHFCEELVARYKRERPGIKARHLLDPATITCWANDYDYDTVFSRQVETLCSEDDVLVLLSTSGNSANIVNALETAKHKSTATIGLLGKDGGQALSLCDHAVVVPSSETDRIQEVHITFIHLFCELIETELYA